MNIVVKGADGFREYRVKKTSSDLRTSGATKTVDLLDIPANTWIYSVQVVSRNMRLAGSHILVSLTDDLLKNVDVTNFYTHLNKPCYLNIDAALPVQATLNVIPLTYWSVGQSANLSRVFVGGCGSSTGALAFGGMNATSDLNAVEGFDEISWTMLSSLNSKRWGAAGVGGLLNALVAGGAYIDTGNPLVNVYHSSAEYYNGTSWSSVSSMNTARGYHGSSGNTGNCLMIGGIGNADTYSGMSAVESYNGASWSSAPSLNTARLTSSCGIVSATLVVAGRSDFLTFLSSTEEYNGTSWTTGGDLGRQTCNHGVFGTATSAVACGGGTNTAVDLAEAYDGTTWSGITCLNQKRLGGAAFQFVSNGYTVAGRLYLVPSPFRAGESGLDIADLLNSTEQYVTSPVSGFLDILPDDAELNFIFKCIVFS